MPRALSLVQKVSHYSRFRFTSCWSLTISLPIILFSAHEALISPRVYVCSANKCHGHSVGWFYISGIFKSLFVGQHNEDRGVCSLGIWRHVTGYDTLLATFRDPLMTSSSEVKISKKNIHASCMFPVHSQASHSEICGEQSGRDRFPA